MAMAKDVFFRLPFAKVEKMKKTFRDKWISGADLLSFLDRLESDLNGRKCGNNKVR